MSPTENSAPTESAATPVNTKSVLRKALIVMLLAVVAAVICTIPQVKACFDKAGPVAQWFRALGGFGIVVFVGAASVLILFGVPRLLLCAIAGVLYDFWLGMAVSLVATMISYYVGFVWIRGRQHKGLDRSALPKQLAFLAGDPGVAGVMVGRVVPAPGMLVTMALALSNVSDGAYLIGSAIGLIPEAVPAVLAGAMPGGTWGKMAGWGLLGVIIVWLFIHYVGRRFVLKKALLAAERRKEAQSP